MRMQRLLDYFRDVAREAKNITFPTRQDVKITSAVIVVLIGIFMVFVSSADFVISRLVKFFFGII
ncbi:MAG: preprotein translocase subunit SecE [Rickettsiales bacterium]|nr:preprotein translocase subunit SecE [Rickettsiales bacterium]